MSDDVTTTIRFTIIDEDTGLSFTDAISIPGNLTDSELKRAMAGVEREKQARFEAWKTAIATPAPAVDPVDELAWVVEQAATLDDRKAALVSEIVADDVLSARADADPVIAAVIVAVQADQVPQDAAVPTIGG